MNKYSYLTADELDQAVMEIGQRGDDLLDDTRLLSEALVRQAGLKPVDLWTRALVYILMNSAIAEGTDADADVVLEHLAALRRDAED